MSAHLKFAAEDHQARGLSAREARRGQTHALLWGLGAGIAGAAAASAILHGTLYGVRPLDPLTYSGVIVALLIAGFAASYLPARRATRVDPATALRYE